MLRNFYFSINKNSYKFKTPLMNLLNSAPRLKFNPFSKYFSLNQDSIKDTKTLNKLKSSFPPIQENIESTLSRNSKISIQLEEQSVHLALLNYIQKLSSEDPSIIDKKGNLVEIHKEKEKIYSVNILGMLKFQVEQRIINSVRTILSSNSNISYLKVYFDGGCANKNRLGCFGCSFYINDKKLFQIAGNIGPNNTNNTSEYFGLVISIIFLDLLRIKDFNIVKVKIYTDSELVCRQVQGKYNINTPHIIILNSIVKSVLKKFQCKIEIEHVLREFNQEADRLANIGKTFENNCFVVNY